MVGSGPAPSSSKRQSPSGCAGNHGQPTVVAVGSLLLAPPWAHWTDAAQPWLDAALTGSAWWRKMEAQNVGLLALWCRYVIFVGLFLYKALLTAGLYALFTVIAGKAGVNGAPTPALRH